MITETSQRLAMLTIDRSTRRRSLIRFAASQLQIAAFIILALVLPHTAGATTAAVTKPTTCSFWQLYVPGCLRGWQDLWGGIFGGLLTLLGAFVGAVFLVRTTNRQIENVEKREERADRQKTRRLLQALAEQISLIETELKAKSNVFSAFLENLEGLRSGLSEDAQALLFDPSLPAVAGMVTSLLKTEGLLKAYRDLRLSRDELTLLLFLPRTSTSKLLHDIDELGKFVEDLESKFQSLANVAPGTLFRSVSMELNHAKLSFNFAFAIASSLRNQCVQASAEASSS